MQTQSNRIKSLVGLLSMASLSSAPSPAHAVTVELIQHAASPFAFTVTKSDPSHSDNLNFDAFKYDSYGTLLSTTLSLTALSNWIYGYSPTASVGSFRLNTLGTVNASQLGGPSNFPFGDEQENVSWSGGAPPPVTLSGTDGVAESQTYTPGGAGRPFLTLTVGAQFKTVRLGIL